MADNVLQKSIPSMVDGLKLVQRKILFSSFEKNFTREAKVAHFSGYVAEHSSYPRGDESDITSTVIGMCQDYTGCNNNINLLMPIDYFAERGQVCICMLTTIRCRF